jgi:hypothetical protein
VLSIKYQGIHPFFCRRNGKLGSLIRHRDNSQIQFISQLLPPSGDHDCSIRADFGERFSHT